MTEQIRANVKSLIKELDKGNLNVIDEFFAPHVVIHMAPNPDMKGLEAYKQFVRGVRTAFPDLQILLEEIILEGDRSAMRYTARGTHKGEFMGMAATGKQVTWAGCEVMHWEGGKVVEGWWYADALGMMQQLGVIPS